MHVMIERCAGLDVHQGSVVACLLTCTDGRVRKQVRSFGTMARDLEQLRVWLSEAGVTHVGMESTGVYWRPVYAALEDGFELIVGNAWHIRNVPGRKTDLKDAEWIAELVSHGLIRPSFVPPKPLRELRELLRYPRKLVESQAAERNGCSSCWDGQHQACQRGHRRVRRLRAGNPARIDRGRQFG